MEKQKSLCWIVLLFFCWNFWEASADQCPVTETNDAFEEIGEYKENADVHFSYRLTDEIRKNSQDFLIEIKLCKSDSLYTACKCQWLSNTYPVCKSFRTEYICEGDNTTMRFSMLIKRTYTMVKWVFFKQMSSPVVLKHTTLHVTYPAKITSLLVNGEESNRTHLVDQNTVVNISCFFTSGNPPVSIRMVNDSGHVVTVKHEQGPLMMSLGVVHCHDVWPTIRCEAWGSELNRSVTILVKCRPQLSFITAEVPDVKRVLEGGMTFAMKSYTSDISRCLVNQEQPRTTMREVKCQIIGHAPNFTLTLDFVNNSGIGEGTWTLHVTSEDWNSSITFLINNNTGKSESTTY
ncbi:uncharacterized protein LOC112568334 [Pomacea canaliculata]|uniref:uncharacterized protein LOC112568334 n=1 Tax=Pomacea canaliculata TaxID=400727 RepID=UPI000D72DEEC|nr:uncharacterized protein LOC112568334 [Pomacea canaliculata]